MERARVIQVIEVAANRGAGTKKDPVRKITQYWDFEGNLLAERDDFLISEYMKDFSQEVKSFYWKNFQVASSLDDINIQS